MPGMAPRTGLDGPEDLSLDVFGEEPIDPYPEGGEEEAPCDHCGAPLGMPHESDCPNDEEGEEDRPDGMRANIQGEGHVFETDSFDKFMDRIVGDEKQRVRVTPKVEDNPQRQRAARYQDRPMNKTRWGGNRG